MQSFFRTLLLIILSTPLIAFAENSTPIPGYTIHHNAIPTGILSPEVARSYGITRSKFRGLLNVSLIKTIPGTTGKAHEAEITARWRNLIGKNQEIAMRKITEGQAIYYIGEFPIVDGERLTFDLQVKPLGGERSYPAQLSQEFYID